MQHILKPTLFACILLGVFLVSSTAKVCKAIHIGADTIASTINDIIADGKTSKLWREDSYSPVIVTHSEKMDYFYMVLLSSSVFVNSQLISTPQALLVWCSNRNNQISVTDLETKQNYVTFDGASISNTDYSSTHVKEIPNTKLLVSLHHSYEFKQSANLEIFDISKKGKASKIYSLGEVFGMVGGGDMTYNSRRSILGAIPVFGRIAYHLFTIDTNASNAGGVVKLNRKSKWHSQYDIEKDNYITAFDFNPAGESIATIDEYGMCLISDVNTNNYVFHLQVGSQQSGGNRCRWSPNTSESLLFVKYDANKLNILDVEKKVLTLHNPVLIEEDYCNLI